MEDMTREDMTSKYIKPNIRQLTAYKAPAHKCDIKLDAHESPYGFELGGALEGIQTNRYPDPDAADVRALMADSLCVSPSQILHGNGSDELIYYLIMAAGGPVLFPWPSFAMYEIIARALDEKPVAVALDADFDIDIKKTLAAIKEHAPRIIFIASPNNPTGNAFSEERVLEIIRAAECLVVVDEAYIAFTGIKVKGDVGDIGNIGNIGDIAGNTGNTGFLKYLPQFENLVIMRTLSKIGLAALRMGFIVARPEIIAEVNKVRLPYNINSFTQAAAFHALKDPQTIRKYVDKIKTDRDKLFKSLKSIHGIHPYPSDANFILFKVTGKSPSDVWSRLLDDGILVKDMSGVVAGTIRVTVGKPDENAAFIKSLEKIMETDVTDEPKSKNRKKD
jgi:histidinol-phosphate aminotransferase